ncbi:MAG: enoyl-CoA hydratase/isomerase family protein [Candidatus Xenobia bacterium]
MSPATQERVVSLKTDSGVGVMTIAHPKSKANPYDFDFMRDLGDCIDEVRRDDGIKIVVLTGSGNFFCAGADIQQLAGFDPQTKATFCLTCHETINRLELIPKVVIAALNGHCVGGGLELALACDFRFMAKGNAETGWSPRIGLPEVKLGLLPGTGGTQRLPRLIGKNKALTMMVEGATVTPEEALQMGLVDKVFTQEELLPTTLEYARTLAGGATRAMGLIKIAVQQGTEMPLSAGLALERELQNRLFLTEDAREGLQAYLEKRPPRFQGR